mmetsp:Transcript_7690/g.11325  ORF Transcript_7690/g.11325 Transcript_7690/m.11325 type:complete len:111 (+) Transcript_7690:961-1293(+)
MKSHPFTSHQLRNKRILRFLTKGFALSGKYSEALEPLSFLIPLEDKKDIPEDIIQVLETLIRSGYQQEQLSSVISQFTSQIDSLVRSVFREVELGNLQEAHNLINKVQAT